MGLRKSVQSRPRVKVVRLKESADARRGEELRARKRRNRQFQKALLRWHEHNERFFPWREAGDPWAVMVAEILLQRTQSAQVEPTYRDFMNRYPTSESLAAASLEAVEKALRPLGLRKRARLLKAIAGQILEKYKGQVPGDYGSLIDLPGVGRYVANAVLCFGFKDEVAIVDSNVLRVLERYFGLRASRSRARDDPAVWGFAATLIPRGKAREFNLALLDFEALVCTPRDPRCRQCPLGGDCPYHHRELAAGVTAGSPSSAPEAI